MSYIRTGMQNIEMLYHQRTVKKYGSSINLEKYESKYRILYHLLQQSISFSTQEPTSEITPSLAALDNAPTLRWREWITGDPEEDMP